MCYSDVPVGKILAIHQQIFNNMCPIDGWSMKVTQHSFHNFSFLFFFFSRPPSSWDFENFVTMATRSLVSDTSRLSSGDCRTVLSLAHSLASLGYFPADLWEFITSRKFANCFMMVKGERFYTFINSFRNFFLFW